MSSLHRRKGGSLEVDKKTIVVRYEGREHTVSWFSGASDEAITRTMEIALGLPRGTPAVVRDPEDGSAIAVSDSLPDGLMLDAMPAARVAPVATSVALGGDGDCSGVGNGSRGRSSNSQGIDGKGSGVAFDNGPPDSNRQGSDAGYYGSNESRSSNHYRHNDLKRSHERSGGGIGVNGNARDGSIGDGGRAGGDAQEFRGEMLKFERVNAHLANERTWLAWVRTALSVLGVALSLVSFTDSMETTVSDSIALAVGISFVVCTLFTYLTGWLRYARVKEVLGWTSTQVKNGFGRFGLQYFSWFLGIILVLTVPIYLMVGIGLVKEA